MPMSPATAAARQAHWRALRGWTLALLLVWALVTFGVAWHARELDFRFFGWPFSFWVAAQGALLVYLGLVGFYAWVSRRLDQALDRDDRT
jgi:putative solute:sodium symporter small subunit